MLKSVQMGQSVDVVLRRGYPMLYNPDGCPKQNLETVHPKTRHSLMKVNMLCLTSCLTFDLLQQPQTHSESKPPRGLRRLTYSHPPDANGSTSGEVLTLTLSHITVTLKLTPIILKFFLNPPEASNPPTSSQLHLKSPQKGRPALPDSGLFT